MSSVNPYQAPRAAVADGAQEHQPVKVFSASGRIGRARYIAYALGYSVLIAFVFGVVGGFLGSAIGSPKLVLGLTAIAWVLILVISILLTIQRCHDFNTTGWLAILALIPLVNLIFWFIPGSDGPNRFGAPTPPNGVFVLIVAWLVPLVVVVGILAAVAIPAYQDYAKRAQQSQPR